MKKRGGFGGSLKKSTPVLLIVGSFIKLAGFGLGLNLIFAPIQAKALTQSFAPTNPRLLRASH
jgi:hypothetical protein